MKIKRTWQEGIWSQKNTEFLFVCHRVYKGSAIDYKVHTIVWKVWLSCGSWSLARPKNPTGCVNSFMNNLRVWQLISKPKAGVAINKESNPSLPLTLRTKKFLWSHPLFQVPFFHPPLNFGQTIFHAQVLFLNNEIRKTTISFLGRIVRGRNAPIRITIGRLKYFLTVEREQTIFLISLEFRNNHPKKAAKNKWTKNKQHFGICIHSGFSPKRTPRILRSPKHVQSCVQEIWQPWLWRNHGVLPIPRVFLQNMHSEERKKKRKKERKEDRKKK